MILKEGKKKNSIFKKKKIFSNNSKDEKYHNIRILRTWYANGCNYLGHIQMNFRSRSPHKRPAFASKDTARARSNGIRIRFSNVPRVACTLRLISRLAHIQRGAHTCSSRAAHTFWICDNTCKFRFVRNSSSPHPSLSLSNIFVSQIHVFPLRA